MMNTKAGVPAIKNLLNKIDWQLLLFLLLFLQVKLAVKVAGIVIIYLMQWNFRFGFKIKNSRLPLFYPVIIAIAFVGLLLNANFTNFRYDVVFVTGICFWVLCILAIHQLKLFVDRNDAQKINQTIIVFFILNAIVSVITLLIIILKTGALNPYLYQGENQKYFISTGDYIKGITFDTSTTNAILNAFGVIYFLVKKNVRMVFLCMSILILTASNLTSLLLLIVFAGLFIFRSDRNQKSVMLVCFFMLVIFLGKVSPQNDDYVSEVFKKFMPKEKLQVKKNDSVVKIVSITNEKTFAPVAEYVDTAKKILIQKEIKSFAVEDKPLIMAAIHANTRPFIPSPNINTAPYQQKNDTSDFRKKLFQFINDNGNSLMFSSRANKGPLLPPGKLVAFQQTMRFMKLHPQKIFFGDGVGNFSSKLAFRASGFQVNGGYPAKLSYINQDFLTNHFDLYLYFFSKQNELHSVINTSDSVYDQLFSEYGIFGLAAVGIFYAWFFIKRINKTGYALPLVFVLLGVFAVGYWFEQLSIVVFAELLLFLNIKEEKKTSAFYA
ncbi:MAG TPA: hypothetical protein VHZ50_18585 [Puia sp.]|nr:hypothetical protein [Puia sp.]